MDVFDELDQTDIFLFPSKHEGYGMALVEAQYAKVHSFVSNFIPDEAIINKELVVPPKISKSESLSVLKIVKAEEIGNSYVIGKFWKYSPFTDRWYNVIILRSQFPILRQSRVQHTIIKLISKRSNAKAFNR